MNEHGYCPNCNLDFDDQDIVTVFINQGKSKEEALHIAVSCYGYKNGATKFNKRISIYDMRKDKTVQYKCPNCNYTWERENE